MNAQLCKAIAIVIGLGLIIWLEPGFVLIAALVSLPYLIFLILVDMDILSGSWGRQDVDHQAGLIRVTGFREVNFVT